MNKRILLLTGMFALIIGLVALYFLMQPDTEAQNPSSNSRVTSNYFAEAKESPIVGSCLAEGTDVPIGSEERTRTEYVAMTHLIDVPAGTNVDIPIASYTENEITGSIRYPDEYGSYNFKLIKHYDQWNVTQFERCGA